MFKRIFGFLGFLIGVLMIGLAIYTLVHEHSVSAIPNVAKIGLMASVFIGFGVTWMRGGTYDRKNIL
jgi:hypothetical protein